MIPIVVLTVLTYLAFVFFSESMNPFVKPALHLHRHRWRYGRRMAIAVLIGGVCTFFLLEVAAMPVQNAAGIGAGVAVLLGLCFSAKKIGYLLRR